MIQTEVTPDYFFYVQHLKKRETVSYCSFIIDDTMGTKYLEKCCLMPRFPEVYLNAVMQRFEPKKVLEIGTYFGGSAMYFAGRSHVEEVHTIDIKTFKQANELWDKTLTREEEEKIFQYLAETDEAKKLIIETIDCDFCFIDGLHTYEGVKFDFECAKRKCDVILFHDYGTNEGVTDFINEQDNIEWQSIELSFALWVKP